MNRLAEAESKSLHIGRVVHKYSIVNEGLAMSSTIESKESGAQLGASCEVGGVRFGVWAPHASAVSVVGEFNSWNTQSHLCESDGRGNWTAFVADARVGQGYKFCITYGDKQLLRIDPRTRQTTNSV